VTPCPPACSPSASSPTHHRDRVTFRRDLARLNALRAAGWTILRFTADDVLRHPERVTNQTRAVLRRPAA
jgi:very-short-patch-repair endonuclease